MKPGRFNRIILLFVLASVLSGCFREVIRTNERFSPAFYSAERAFKRVQILPIHMQMYRFEADGKVVPLTGQIAQTAQELNAGLGEQLKSKGYTVVVPKKSGDETLFKVIDPELAQFEGPSFVLSEKIGLGWEADREKVQVTEFKFLDSVLAGPRSEGVDAYLFVDYTVFHRVPGFQYNGQTSQRVPSWVGGVIPGYRSATRFEDNQLELGLVRAAFLDPRTGNLLWANSHDFGFRHGFHESGSWQYRINAVDSASVSRGVLQALITSEQSKPTGSIDKWIWQRKLSLDVQLVAPLPSHECKLDNLARKAFSEKAAEQSIHIVDGANDLPHLVLRVDNIREGHIAKADTKVSITAWLYMNEKLVGNQVIAENVNVWQSYDVLCGRLESALGRSLEPLWLWLEAPTWSPWIK